MINTINFFNNNSDLISAGLFALSGIAVASFCYSNSSQLVNAFNSCIQNWTHWFSSPSFPVPQIKQQQIDILQDQVTILHFTFENLIRPLACQSIDKLIDYRSLVDLEEKLLTLKSMVNCLTEDPAIMSSSFASNLLAIKSDLSLIADRALLLRKIQYENTGSALINGPLETQLKPRIIEYVDSTKNEFLPVWENCSITYEDIKLLPSEYMDKISDYIDILVNTTAFEFFPSMLNSAEGAIALGALLTTAFLSGDIPEEDEMGEFIQEDLQTAREEFLQSKVAMTIFKNSYHKEYSLEHLSDSIRPSWEYLHTNWMKFPFLLGSFQNYGRAK